MYVRMYLDYIQCYTTFYNELEHLWILVLVYECVPKNSPQIPRGPCMVAMELIAHWKVDITVLVQTACHMAGRVLRTSCTLSLSLFTVILPL